MVDADLSFVRRSLRQAPGGSEALQAPTQELEIPNAYNAQ